MVSIPKTIFELSAANLRRRLEEQNLENSGTKTQQQVLLDVEKNPDEKMLNKLENILLENSKRQEEILLENFRCLEEKLLKSFKGLEEKFLEHTKNTEDTLKKILEAIEQKSTTNTVKEKHKHESDKISQSNLSITKKFAATQTNKHKNESTTKKKLKSQISEEEIHLSQLEAAAKTSNEKINDLIAAVRKDTFDFVQALPLEDQDHIHGNIKHLGYCHEHIQVEEYTQLKNRSQKEGENLKEFEADVARLVRISYPQAPENFLECLAVRTFIDGLQNRETKRLLWLKKPKTLNNAVTHALEFEAAKEALNGQVRIEEVKYDKDNKEFIKKLVDVDKKMSKNKVRKEDLKFNKDNKEFIKEIVDKVMKQFFPDSTMENLSKSEVKRK